MRLYEFCDFDLLDEDVASALAFATQAHAGQTRSDNSPYVEHVKRVAASVEQFKRSHNLDAMIQAALLHDTLEDTHTTHEDLVSLFGGLVASLVKELTSDKQEIARVGKAQYLASKMSTMSSYALVIKLADRLDNIQDITTAKTPEWRRRYRDETLHILDQVTAKRALSATHKKLIHAIRAKLAEVE